MGEGLSEDDSWEPASQEQADREREREKKRARGQSKAREGVRGRLAHRLDNARLGPALMFSIWNVFLKCGERVNVWVCVGAFFIFFWFVFFSVQAVSVLTQSGTE